MDTMRHWMMLCEDQKESFFGDDLVNNCRAIGRWYQGWFMRSHGHGQYAQEDMERTIAAFQLAAPLHRFAGLQRLWRVVPESSVDGDVLRPSDKLLQSWSETEHGARMFFGSEIAHRATERYVLTEADIDGALIVFSNAHLTTLMNRLEAMDDEPAARAWNLLESNVRPHEYQHEVVILFPHRRPVKLTHTPDGFLGR